MDASTAVVNNQSTVSFYNDKLTAIIDSNGEIWAIMNEILRNIGFDETKVENQRKAWNQDIVISKGSKILPSLTESRGVQQTSVINRRYIPLALAKISITPTMQRNQPELVEKLIRYQEECADVLYQHFYSREITVSSNLPLSREEMAMYIAAIQEQANAHTEEVKNMCTGTFAAVCKIVQKQAEENSKVLSIIADTASKQYSSSTLNISKITDCLNNMKVALEDFTKSIPAKIEVSAAKEETKLAAHGPSPEDLFLNVVKELLKKICLKYSIDQKTAYTIIYSRMADIDDINVYTYRNENSIIKSISKDAEARESFIKCARILCGEMPFPKKEKRIDCRNVNFESRRVDVINITSDANKCSSNKNPLWTTPQEIKDLINEYRNKVGRNWCFEHATNRLFKELAKRSGCAVTDLTQKARDYARTVNQQRCSTSCYIFANKELFSMMKKIVEEA